MVGAGKNRKIAFWVLIVGENELLFLKVEEVEMGVGELRPRCTGGLRHSSYRFSHLFTIVDTVASCYVVCYCMYR